MEKLLPVIYHNFTVTVKRKHVFVAPREAGHWQLWASFDARANVLGEVERAKKQGYLVEVVVTDDDVHTVSQMLHKRSFAFYRAGLGPDRTPPLQRPVPVHVAVARAAIADRRRRKRKQILSLPSKEESPATSGPSQPSPAAEEALTAEAAFTSGIETPKEEIPSDKIQPGSDHHGPQSGPGGYPTDGQTPSFTFHSTGTGDQQDR